MKFPPTFRRDKFSGHIILTHPTMPEFTVELYYSRPFGWTIHDIAYHGVSCIQLKKLHDKSNIVYHFWRKQVIPRFIYLREALAWMEYVDGTRTLKSLT